MSTNNILRLVRWLSLAFLSLFLLACSRGVLSVEETEQDEDPISEENTIPLLARSPSGEVTGISLSAEQKEWIDVSNRQAWNYLSFLRNGTASSFLSPLSLNMALWMAASGASGATADEILAAAGLPGADPDALNEFSRKLLDYLPAADLSIGLRLNNLFVAESRLPVKKVYVDELAQAYYAPAVNLDFSQPDAVLSKINDWSSRNTEGLIPAILDRMDPFSTAFLLNALYYKGLWVEPFTTLPDGRDFRCADGSSAPVTMMKRTFQARYFQGTDFSAVAVPMGKRGCYEMDLFLPAEVDGLDALVSGMADSQAAWLSGAGNSTVKLTLPVFSVTANHDCQAMLQRLGMQQAFTEEADFSGITDVIGLRITQVLQKARIRVDEFGTEAAAVSAVLVGATGRGPGEEEEIVEMTLDHPFVFSIRERATGLILFCGCYTGR